ncbi:MAG: hypothetical protein ACTHU0_29370 [Kofleriaceae bacterium]
MHRWALLLALVGCEPPAPAPEPPPLAWVYAPAPPAWQLGELRGRLGRSQPPQLPLAAGITGALAAPTTPLRLATPWQVPGRGPARAIVYGLEGDRQAIELVDIDRGLVLWRDSRSCGGPVVGVTEDVVVCADASGAWGIGLDGKPRWHTAQPFLAITGDRVVVAGDAGVVVLGADDGEPLAEIALPSGVALDAVIASCGDAGRELFASGQDGRLVRIAEARGGPAISWAAPIGAIGELDPCDGDSVLVRTPLAADRTSSLIALARSTGAVTGQVDGVRGYWAARDGSGALEISTSAGVVRWPRDLGAPSGGAILPPLGELLAERGDLRLVRASDHTAVVLDRGGVRAHLLFAAMGGAISDTAVLGASWIGSPGETVTRSALPPRHRRALRLPRRFAISVPAELRDLPAAAPLDPAAAIDKPDTARHAIGPIALDAAAPAVIYAVTQEQATSDRTSAGIAAVDLAARTWRWQRGDGCGAGAPVAIAIAREVVVCGARTESPRAATVRATSRDGAARWEWQGDNVDRVQAAGDVVAVHDARWLHVIDAATGHLRGRLASDDGAPMRAAVIDVDGATYLVTYERGRLVVRLPGAGMLAAWSIIVDGVVRALGPSQEGVLVELEDGDAYRVDLRTAEIAALPGVGVSWRAAGDVVTGETTGGPVPGPPAPPPVPPRGWSRRALPRAPARRTRASEPARPRLWTPVAPPPSLGDSWQYTLYELGGGLRARNDYALVRPIEPAARGPAGSPLVVASGPGLRDVLVLDPRTGDPVKRVQLPAEIPAVVFGTVVDGTPVAGALLGSPLRAIVF